ncbi:MAG: hypothetical protein JOY71_13975 [Acetobacteraceae bacterium]|nr:hypothetical protein [Acetobacteraceae bacterium]MBV8589121.1 hypothetical protein [Acetobacteraceae bacterium]
MSRIGLLRAAILGLVACGLANRANAAALSITDNASSVAVSLNDFENGFSINGAMVQKGLNQAVSVTEPKSFSFNGSWVDLGRSASGAYNLVLKEANGTVSDVLSYTVATSGGVASITGSFCSIFAISGSRCAVPTSGATTVARDTAGPFPITGAAYLTGVLIEADASVTVTEPGALPVLGIGLIGIFGLTRWRG